jgi:hypothetical protein
MRQPLPNLRTRLWCCAARLSQCASVSRPPVRVRPSPGYAPAPGCAASRPARGVLCAVFFRLAGLAHGRFIALKARVLIQDGVAGIAERLMIGNLLIMHFPRVGLTQVADPLGLGMDYHHVLIAMGLMLATVVQGLFFWALRALPAAVGPINDQFRRLPFAAFLERKLAGLTFGHHLQGLQGRFQQGQQVMHPVVHPRLAQLEYLAQQRLQGIGFGRPE